jgi:PPOX class probable F420-dependent enzyme
MAEMSKSQQEDFLAQALVARVATVRPDGRPHVAPVWFLWEGRSIYVWTIAGFVRTKNLRRNPACAVTIDVTEGGLRYKGIILEGNAELIDEPEFARDMAARICTKYLGSDGAQAPSTQRMMNGANVIIRLTPSKVLTWDDTREALAPLS